MLKPKDYIRNSLTNNAFLALTYTDLLENQDNVYSARKSSSGGVWGRGYQMRFKRAADGWRKHASVSEPPRFLNSITELDLEGGDGLRTVETKWSCEEDLKFTIISRADADDITETKNICKRTACTCPRNSVTCSCSTARTCVDCDD